MGRDRERTARTGSVKGRIGALQRARSVVKRDVGDVPSFAALGGFGGVVDRLLDNGAAIFIARTRDGGAISVTVRDYDSELREWPKSQDELASLLRAIGDAYAPDEVEPTAGPQRAS